jgi:hypothetical protein
MLSLTDSKIGVNLYPTLGRCRIVSTPTSDQRHRDALHDPYARGLIMKTVRSLTAIAFVIGCVLSSAPSFAGTISNGITLNGITLNGITLNGITLNGIGFNGIGFNGASGTFSHQLSQLASAPLI